MVAAAFAMTTAVTIAAASPTVTTLSYGTDEKQKVDIYVDGDGTAKPIAVFFHGGVWQHGDRAEYARVGRGLAQRGFVAIVASYRLTPNAVWPAQGEDAAAVVDLALRVGKRFGGDPAKLVVVGHSAGAQMAAMLAYDPRLLAAHQRKPADIRALALLSCVCDLRQPLDESQPDGGFAIFVAPTFGHDAKALEAASPLAHAVKLGIPILTVTSDHDYRAMHDQTTATRDKLRALGDEVAFVDVKGVDHFGIVAADATLDAIARLR